MGAGGSAWVCWGPGFPFCSSKGRRRGSGPQIFPRPEPQAKAAFPLAACSPCLCLGLFPLGFLLSGFLSFPSGRLLELLKTPSRKFACCHEIMQKCSRGWLGDSSVCLLETWRGRTTHLRGQTPLSPTVLGSDKCRHTKEGSKSWLSGCLGVGPWRMPLHQCGLRPWDKELVTRERSVTAPRERPAAPCCTTPSPQWHGAGGRGEGESHRRASRTAISRGD